MSRTQQQQMHPFGMDIDLDADDERVYLYDPDRALSELSVWMHKNRPLGDAFVLVKVEGGFEIAITDYALNDEYWVLGDCLATSRAEALQQLGEALDELERRQELQLQRINNQAANDPSLD